MGIEEKLPSGVLLTGVEKLVGFMRKSSVWPATYYMHSSLGTYTKGLEPRLMLGDILFLAGCIPVFLAISYVGLKKQEK